MNSKLTEIKLEKCRTPNKRFGEIGVKVITRTSARPLTVSGNPNGVQLIPNFAKPPGRYLQAAEVRFANEVEM